MINFAAKSSNGQHILGVGLSDADIAKLKHGQPIVLDLGSVHVGLWRKEADGTRSFQQPRDSTIVIIPGDTAADIGEFLGVQMPELSELHK